jgi:hypothetical protein
MRYATSYKPLKYLSIFMLSVLISCKGNLSQTLLFEDEFDHLPHGYLSNENGSLMKHYYIPGSGQSGSWTVSAFGPDQSYHSAWEIMEGDEGNYLRQNYHAVNEDLEPLSRHIHPIIIAGDSIWHDYKVEFSFSPGQLLDKCGVVFKYRNSRCYYFYGMEGNMLVLKMVRHATAPFRPYEEILASTPFIWVKGDVYKGAVSIKQNRIYTLLNDSLSLIAEDNTYERGKVGFLSDVPADFYSMEVTTLNREKRKLNRYIAELATAKAQRINENPEPTVWKKIETENFGAGRSIRFGDLNNDGEIDILVGQVEQRGPNKAFTDLVCLTALTVDGDILWQRGTPNPDRPLLTKDVGFQIHDLDGDGTREVVCLMNNRIMILEGKTGRQIRSISFPLTQIEEKKINLALGSSMFFCDILGKGRDSDIIIRDNYNNLWTYDEHLRMLWKQTNCEGIYPYASDLDNDGKDEVLSGYSLFDDDGAVIWNKGDDIGGHANAVVVASLNPNSDSLQKIIYGAGDWGTIILNTDGDLITHHPVGNVQNLSVANFRSDLPGLEMISVNFWGNQGLVCFYDSQGEKYHSFDSGPFGSMCLPVNWRGDGQEYFLLNTNSGDGGLFDGYGHLVVSFPDDGHPDLCSAVLDFTGDYRDEIVTWNRHNIWIYTQVDNSRNGKVYHPSRNPHYNYSSYQVTLSEPGWND